MRTLLHFLSRWQNLIGLGLVSVFVCVAIAAPQIALPTDPENPESFKVVGRATDSIPHPPSATSPLGTTTGQHDMFYSIVWGTRSALKFGLTVALATAVFGVLLGAIGGFRGGLVNGFIMRITDAFLAIPLIAGIWLFQQLLFPPHYVWEEAAPIQVVLEALGLNPVIMAFVLFSWMPYARLTNANVERLRHADFILASQSLGASRTRIIFRHLLPNTVAPAIVLLARDIGGMVVLEAAFTFIGLGLGNEWGALLVQNRSWIIGIGGNPFTYWWAYIPPTLALIFFGIGWNLLGDGLNDLLNPRQR